MVYVLLLCIGFAVGVVMGVMSEYTPTHIDKRDVLYLFGVLKKYGDHTPYCALFVPSINKGDRCTCGWDEQYGRLVTIGSKAQ
jgi:hypothetical protein